MSSVFWLLLFLSKYFCLFSLKSMVLGVFLLMCSFSMSILMSMYLMSWYSLMFFLVYMGGLLVLFIYISSLKFNPVFYFSNMNPMGKLLLKFKVLMFFWFVLTQITWNTTFFSWSNLDSKNFSLNLFKENEMLFLVKMGVLLLLVLWVMTKLSFPNRGALRPLF